jgi:hypothetical protein
LSPSIGTLLLEKPGQPNGDGVSAAKIQRFPDRGRKRLHRGYTAEPDFSLFGFNCN